MMDAHAVLKFCACCPAPCRSAVGGEAALRDETGTPSSLAMIALAVIAGELPLDDGVRRALADTDAARRCIAACPYGHDAVAAVGRLPEITRPHGTADGRG
jgi:hypothetical protein